MDTDEVALFIDFENIRYSLLNHYQVEPDIGALMDKARKYGRVSVAMAYADFSEHPPLARRQLDIAGITARDIPLRRSQTDGVERVKSTSDMHMVMDIIETLLDRPQVGTYVLMAGDADYLRVTTWLRNRFAKRVVICGVPGSVSQDLVLAAGHEDPIEVAASPTEDLEPIISSIIRMVDRGPAPLTYWTVKIIAQWANSPRQNIAGSHIAKRDAIRHMQEQGILLQEEEARGDRTVRVARLNYEHPRVHEVLGLD